jgi:hypothetical protein
MVDGGEGGGGDTVINNEKTEEDQENLFILFLSIHTFMRLLKQDDRTKSNISDYHVLPVLRGYIF